MKIVFSVIHNNSEKTKLNRSKLRQFANNFNFVFKEFSWQNPYPAQLNKFHRFFSHIVVQIRYQRYRSKVLGVNLGFKGSISFLIHLLKGCVNVLFKWTKEEDKYSAIVRAVTRKHIAAWRASLEEIADFYFFIEDDAVVSAPIKPFIKIIHKYGKVFLDLAGGFDEEVIAPNSYKRNCSDNCYIYNGLVSNTACAYGVPRDVLEELVFLVEDDYLILNEPIDFLLNSLGMKMRKTVTTIRPINLPIVHGSMNGYFDSQSQILQK